MSPESKNPISASPARNSKATPTESSTSGTTDPRVESVLVWKTMIGVALVVSLSAWILQQVGGQSKAKNAVEWPTTGQSNEQRVEECLASVQARMGTISLGSDIVTSVRRQQLAVAECHALAAGREVKPTGELARLSAEDRFEAYAQRIEQGGGTCIGIANILRTTLRVQGAGSPHLGQLLGDAERYGCL